MGALVAEKVGPRINEMVDDYVMNIQKVSAWWSKLRPKLSPTLTGKKPLAAGKGTVCQTLTKNNLPLPRSVSPSQPIFWFFKRMRNHPNVLRSIHLV